MGRALLYYEWHSRWNRLSARLRRLRQPKYLVGAVVGGLYFYFYIFGAWFRGRGRGGVMLAPAPEHRFLVESAAALVLLVVLLLMWIIPHERAALIFSEAEVAFLFPAPVGAAHAASFQTAQVAGGDFVQRAFYDAVGGGAGEVICCITSAGGGCFPW